MGIKSVLSARAATGVRGVLRESSIAGRARPTWCSPSAAPHPVTPAPKGRIGERTVMGDQCSATEGRARSVPRGPSLTMVPAGALRSPRPTRARGARLEPEACRRARQHPCHAASARQAPSAVWLVLRTTTTAMPAPPGRTWKTWCCPSTACAPHAQPESTTRMHSGWGSLAASRALQASTAAGKVWRSRPIALPA